MPVAIIVREDQAPVVIQENSAAAMIEHLNRLKGTPELSDESAANRWLRSLPFPSGWFSNAEEARASAMQVVQQATMTPAELISIRKQLKLSRADFAERIGYGGNSNTRHKLIFELEKGKKPIRSEKAQVARALCALMKC